MAKFVFLLSFLIFLANRGRADEAFGCDEGWINVNQQCYMFINDKKVTWSEAEEECNRYDSSLMYFDNIDEVIWYINYVSVYPAPAYWTSMNDISWQGQNQPGTGHWKWGKYSQANTTIFQWNQSPANDGYNNCGGINAAGTMSDVGCNSTQGFICNVELNGGQCPDSTWTKTPTDCYYVSNTSDISQLMTWDQARAKCASFGSNSHLLTVDDANDQTFLQNALPYVTMSMYLYWTGLQYKNNIWQWFNGATFNQKFFKWAKEPDNVAGKEDCVVIRYNGKLSDRGCNMQQNYICKKSADYGDSTLNTGCSIWTRAGQMCYMFYTDPKSSWSDAKSTCQSMQGDLINVKDPDTMSWLRVQMLDPTNDYIFWTALNDRDQEGTFKWSDGTVVDSNVISWNAEPNDWWGEEDCGILIPSRFTYNDGTCQFHAIPLCEVDNVQSCPSKGGSWVSRNADKGSGLNCYLFGDYSSESVRKTQPEALQYCQSLADSGNNVPQLLVVDTAAEKQFLKGQVSKYADNIWGFWTMMTDAAEEGFWTWGGTAVIDPTLVDWDKEPSSLTPTTDCANVQYNGYFQVVDCASKLGFICGRKAFQPWTSRSSSTRFSPEYQLTIVLVSITLLIRSV
ncbi:C-type mannose receptor 2-like [Mercenaria mercenaria]|uniref:C-type mannose receptor 2-like n=1 Tax=Mercenaria mercenaria TaxID=6596 RepID=UPI00234F2B3C|nr:C-type mannose receptor 2-like [Mercenaria mercenaria]